MILFTLRVIFEVYIYINIYVYVDVVFVIILSIMSENISVFLEENLCGVVLSRMVKMTFNVLSWDVLSSFCITQAYISYGICTLSKMEK